MPGALFAWVPSLKRPAVLIIDQSIYSYGCSGRAKRVTTITSSKRADGKGRIPADRNAAGHLDEDRPSEIAHHSQRDFTSSRRT